MKPTNKPTNKNAAPSARLWPVALLVLAVFAVAALLIRETFITLLPGLWEVFTSGDEQSMSEYLSAQGNLRSFMTLWFLSFVQVISIVIPAMPVQLAAGIAYGPWEGFLNSFSAAVLANFTVFLLARHLLRAINRLTEGNPKVQKMLDSIRNSRDPWFYTMLALITPGLPNGIIPYAAAQAHMPPKRFLAALLISLPLPNLCTCAAGSLILSGNWSFSILLGVLLYALVGILFWKREPFLAWAHATWDKHKK
ncbi:MAG: VTT domain-containing protein [Gemmiger sp.]|nr:VTT domain-containing protein [Gemmiger sp.]